MEQIKLFEDSEVFQKERPTITEAQKESLYLAWAEYCFKRNWNLSHDEEYLIHVFKYLNLFTDVYITAKELEKEKVLKVNFEVCEWLNTLKLDFEKIIDDNEIAWFKAHKFKFKFSKQSKIKFKSAYRTFNFGDLGNILVTSPRGYYLVENKKTNNVYEIPFEILEEIGEKN